MAGFVRAEGFARVTHHGTVDEVAGVSSFTASLFRYPAAVDRAVAEGWATAAEFEEMSLAWAAWGEQPGAFLARFWCEAVAWADQPCTSPAARQ